MPKDVILVSLPEDNHFQDSLFNPVAVSSSSNIDQSNAQSLTPPELIAEYDREFLACFANAQVDYKEIYSNITFFKEERSNQTKIDSILKEHSYSKK